MPVISVLLGIATACAIEVRHMKDASCTLCHPNDKSAALVLLDGSALASDLSPMLCGQCHGEKHVSWQWGEHGKRSGSWRVPGKLKTCVQCHDPHVPKFKEMKPLPAPIRPRNSVHKPHESETP